MQSRGHRFVEHEEPTTPSVPPLVHTPFTDRSQTPVEGTQQATCGQGSGLHVEPPTFVVPAGHPPFTDKTHGPPTTLTFLQQGDWGQVLVEQEVPIAPAVKGPLHTPLTESWQMPEKQQATSMRVPVTMT